MRVAPVGLACSDVASVLREAERSAAPTHSHPDGIKGAQATALAVFLARRGAAKEEIRKEIAGRFGYDLDRTIDGIRPHYLFDVTCQGTVPEAILAFLESTDYESTVRLAISLAATAIRWRRSPAASRTPITTASPTTSSQRCGRSCPRNSSRRSTGSKRRSVSAASRREKR